MSGELVGAPDLHPGQSGEWVTYLQQLLTAASTGPHNFSVPITGHFDAATEAALKKYQAWVPMDVTGRVDGEVWLRLSGSGNTLEAADEEIGQIAGDHHAGDHTHKLSAGKQAGRHGWKQVNLRFQIHDCWNYPMSGPAYVRFQSTDDQSESDESGIIDDGWLVFSQVWIPSNGTLWLYASAAEGGITSIEGNASLTNVAAHELGFSALQDGDTKQVSVADAHGYVSEYGEKVTLGVNLGELSGGLEESHSFGENSSHTTGEQIPVRLPHPSFTMTPLA